VERGRTGWQKASGYNARAGAEGAMFSHKKVFGRSLPAGSTPPQERAKSVRSLISAKVVPGPLIGRPKCSALPMRKN
jgi:hypothetical protein